MSANGKPAASATQRMAAGALYSLLHQFHPLEKPETLQRIASFIVREQEKLAPALENYVSLGYTHGEFSLIEPKLVQMPGQKRDGLVITAPLRLEKCRNVEEVMKSISTFAIMHSPISQALLALHDYRIRLAVGSPAGKAAPEEPKVD